MTYTTKPQVREPTTPTKPLQPAKLGSDVWSLMEEPPPCSAQPLEVVSMSIHHSGHKS